MASQPVFGNEDRVRSAQVDLPAELRGVTDPVKIAQYYQSREATLREELRKATTTPPRTASTVEQHVDTPPVRTPVTMSVEEATAARSTLIESARRTAMANKPYWSRLEADINKVMGEQPPENQVDFNVWTTAYNTLVGMNMDRLLREDREVAETARVAVERSAAPPDASTAPVALPIEVTGKILPGLNITEEQYRKAQTNIAKGIWPLTSENISGKRLTVGGGN
jgi:hypothetical protein